MLEPLGRQAVRLTPESQPNVCVGIAADCALGRFVAREIDRELGRGLLVIAALDPNRAQHIRIVRTMSTLRRKDSYFDAAACDSSARLAIKRLEDRLHEAEVVDQQALGSRRKSRGSRPRRGYRRVASCRPRSIRSRPCRRSFANRSPALSSRAIVQPFPAFQKR